MRLHDVEPSLGDPEVRPLSTLPRDLLRGRRCPSQGPWLIAVDGRSSNGKSTLAARIAGTAAHGAVVHTDDIAWWHSRFGWDDVLVREIIEPLRRGEAIDHRPPAWAERGRAGAIRVSDRADLVIIEGVGAGRSTISPLVDAVIWVRSDLEVTELRSAQRVEAGELDQIGYDEWMAEEIPFLAADRPWERADLIVCGSSDVPHDPDAEVVVLTG